MTPNTNPFLIIADLYMRLSDLRESDIDTFEDRKTKLCKKAAELGWQVGKVIIENDYNKKDGKRRGASAFKTRKVVSPNGMVLRLVKRDGFDELLNRWASGLSNAVLAEDLDRLTRNPYDGERMLSTAKTYGINAQSLTGTLRLTDGGTSDEQFIARMMINIAWKASEDTARRVRDSCERRAKEGKFHGGNRPFGFEADGITRRWDECLVIETCTKRVLQGVSRRSLAKELRESGIQTVSGKPWSAEGLTDILLRPRNAGYEVLRDEIIGDAKWGEIVPRPLWDDVVEKLTDKDKPKENTSPARVYLGSGHFLCGVCADGTVMHVTGGKRAPRYRCSGEVNHLTRNVAHTDEHVKAHVVSILNDPHVCLFTPLAHPDIDVVALREERRDIRAKLEQYAIDEMTGTRTKSQVDAATRWAKGRIAEIDRLTTMATAIDSVLAECLNADDPAQYWLDAPLSVQQAVMSELVTVTIEPIPTGSKGSGFKPEYVRVELNGSFKVLASEGHAVPLAA